MNLHKPRLHTAARTTKTIPPTGLERLDASAQGELCSIRKAPETAPHDVKEGIQNREAPPAESFPEENSNLGWKGRG